mmetsp:Transcript_100624/g.197515  ORF Transcript_100624/g.197515 Transcript_100624/m.197515 type:complete len:88 (-) Transcript_100624:290-553(-)
MVLTVLDKSHKGRPCVRPVKHISNVSFLLTDTSHMTSHALAPASLCLASTGAVRWFPLYDSHPGAISTCGTNPPHVSGELLVRKCDS